MKVVNIHLLESQDQYQSLRSFFEDLLVHTSSDIVDDPEDIAAMFQANKRIVDLINESIQINPEKDLRGRVEKKIKLFALVTDYLEHYWDSIPKEIYPTLRKVALLLYSSISDINYVNKLDKKLYRFYQGVIFSYLYKLAEKLKIDNLNEYLWEARDNEDNVIYKFPISAEEKAIDRINNLENRLQWPSFPKRKKEITDEEIEEYMKKRGLS